MAREIHDHYFRQAKREGYLSRAAYKLIEIDDRKQVLKEGDGVVDLGAAPGSWLQVASERVGAGGFVVGIDLKPIRLPRPLPNVRTIVGDAREVSAEEILGAAGCEPGSPNAAHGGLFRVVLSDMAPSTTGDRTIDHHGSMRLCHVVLARCGELLAPGGNLVLKALEGEAYPELLARCRRLFDAVKGFKPKASRSISSEMYIIARGYRGPAADRVREEASGAGRRPSRGWGGG